MANPRNTISHKGVFRRTEKYIIDGTSIVYDADEPHGCVSAGPEDGLAVTLSDDDTISLAGDGEYVLGKLILVESDGKATVQVGGYMTLPGGTGASLTVGKAIVGDLSTAAEGYIREVATGTAAELGVQNGHIQDASDATAVWVLL